MKRHATLAALLIGLVLSSCSDDDGEQATTTPAPSEAPSASAPPPASPPGAFELPPQFLDCMADQGFDIPPTGGPPPELLSNPDAQLAFQGCVQFLPPGIGNH